MKKTLIIFFILASLLVVSGCDISPFYNVSFIDEGIVTQNGKIIGVTKESGLHFKIPIIQKVHMVNVHQIRFLSVPINKNETFEVQILWHVKDSIKYFKSSEQTGDDKKIESKILPIFAKIIDTYVSEFLLDDSQSQNDSIELSNTDCGHIKRLVQESSVEYGLNIVDVEYKKK